MKSKAVEWVPLRSHPLFPLRSRSPGATSSAVATAGGGAAAGGHTNIAAWHAESSRLFVWDAASRCVHRLALRFSDPDPNVVLEAACPAEILLVDTELKSDIHHISLNVDGTLLLLFGYGVLHIMHLFERASLDGNKFTCRVSSVASSTYRGYSDALKILQVAWHPYSSTHLGVLSSDSVFRLFDLSIDLEQPEQEYYLQPVKPRDCHDSALICPVCFSFGGHHLWDRFSIFVLFSNGAVYVLCPIVPFGSLCSWKFIMGLYEDVSMFGLKSTNSNVVRNSRMAIAWLEATFPELAEQSFPPSNIQVSRACPYAPLDASISLQGPFCRISHAINREASEACNEDCEGKAVGFIYSSIGKDSVLVIAWSSGQLQIDAIADEVQPFWDENGGPRVRVDSYGSITGVAMICEATSHEFWTNDMNLTDGTWLGHPPPLLRLGIVDLALPENEFRNRLVSLYTDPLLLDRFYCLHGRGVDLIALHFLPFSPVPEMDSARRPPSVYSILSIFHDDTSSQSLSGFVTVTNSFGDSQIVGITSSYNCLVLEANNCHELHSPHFDMGAESVSYSETGTVEILSKELLSGPQPVSISHSVRTGTVIADTVEGRAFLHRYIKHFHQHYVEYAHKVYIELERHADHVKAILDEQHRVLREAEEKISNLEIKEENMKNRAHHAFHICEQLERRLERLRSIPGVKTKPLSKAEKEFKMQLDRYADVELDALRSSIDGLNARLKRFVHLSPTGSSIKLHHAPERRRSRVSDNQILQIKSSLGVLSNMNTEMSQKLKIIEKELDSREK